MNNLGTLPTTSGHRRYLDPSQMAEAVGIEAWDKPSTAYREQVQKLRKLYAALTSARTGAQQANVRHKDDALRAAREGKPAPADPLPKLLAKEEEALRAVEVQEAVVVELSDELAEIRERLAPEFVALAAEQRAEAMAALELGVQSMKTAWAYLSEAQWLRMWGSGSHKATRSVRGVEHLNKLATTVEELADTKSSRYVSPAAMKALEAGEDVEDIHGNPLTFAEAEDLHKRGKLKVNYGKPLPRNAPEFV